jgi:hypothetical protein
MGWGYFYSDIDELTTAAESTSIDCREVAQAESAVNVGFSRLRAGDLAVVAIHESSKCILPPSEAVKKSVSAHTDGLDSVVGRSSRSSRVLLDPHL